MLGLLNVHNPNSGIIPKVLLVTASTEYSNANNHKKLAIAVITLVVIMRLYENGYATWINQSMLIGTNISLVTINVDTIGICVSSQLTLILTPMR